MPRMLRHALVAAFVISLAATPLVTERTCATSPTFIWPARGPVSQGFSTNHPAIDISVPIGMPVVAARSGTVIYAGWKNNGGGFVVDIDHGGGVVTTYNHLSAVEVGVGQWVNVGQRIAASGATGNVTGPHLHFGVAIGGLWVNPLPLLVVKLPDTALPC